MEIFKYLFFYVVCIFTLLVPSTKADHLNKQSSTSSSKLEIEEVVRDYLITHPEVIEEAIRALQAKRKAKEKKLIKSSIIAHRAALQDHPMTPVSGNKHGSITVVEFFDYQCGYCKQSLNLMINLLRTNKNVRIAWKELPILGATSRAAAKAAMAAAKQEKYLAFHIVLMKERGRLSKDRLIDVAKEVGLDIKQFRKDMQSPEIDAYLDETLQLARTLGIHGTPAFIVGDEVISGSIDDNRMRQIINRQIIDK